MWVQHCSELEYGACGLFSIKHVLHMAQCLATAPFRSFYAWKHPSASTSNINFIPKMNAVGKQIIMPYAISLGKFVGVWSLYGLLFSVIPPMRICSWAETNWDKLYNLWFHKEYVDRRITCEWINNPTELKCILNTAICL